MSFQNEQSDNMIKRSKSWVSCDEFKNEIARYKEGHDILLKKINAEKIELIE